MRARARARSRLREAAPEGYDDRVLQEIERFTDELDISRLPEIFSYWSNGFLRPRLEELGYSYPEDFFAKEIVRKSDSQAGAVRILSIGSGNCDTEMRIAQLLADRGFDLFHFTCLDLTPAMLERGADLAAASGFAKQFAFEVGDFNHWSPSRTWDMVLANQCLHHVQDLEHLFASIHDAIGREGVFITSDMIGRNGHQRWPEALSILQEFWCELPPEYQYNLALQRQEDEFLDWDCSAYGFEGIRAQDILPLAMQQFGFRFFFAFGNVISPFVDRSFGHHFSPEREWDRNFIDRVNARDDAEIQAGRIKPTHMMAVMVRDRAAKPRCWNHLTPDFCVRPVT